jgi:hypothetical protein
MHQLLFGLTAELIEVSVSFEESFLNQVGGIDFTLKAAPHLEPSEEGQVVAIKFQQLPERDTVPGPGEAQELLGDDDAGTA